MQTIETKTSITGMKISLISDNTERKFNVKLSYPEDEETDYLFPTMVREKKARRIYKLAR